MEKVAKTEGFGSILAENIPEMIQRLALRQRPMVSYQGNDLSV